MRGDLLRRIEALEAAFPRRRHVPSLGHLTDDQLAELERRMSAGDECAAKELLRQAAAMTPAEPRRLPPGRDVPRASP